MDKVPATSRYALLVIDKESGAKDRPPDLS